MLTTHVIDTSDRRQVRHFVDLPYRLYKDHPLWVPPPRSDIAAMLNRDKHPFYEHSDAEFFTAERDGEIVGRLAVIENKSFNTYHDTRKAQFYLFEAEDDYEIVQTLFNRAIEWAKAHGLNELVGPKGFGPLDGYGILVEGFEHRQMMTMMNYNYPYYPQYLEKYGFEKEVDFVSCYLPAESFRLPERVDRIAERVKIRSSLEVHAFDKRRELRKWMLRLGKTYNASFINNWEYYPLSDNEMTYAFNNVISVADPRLIKLIFHNDEIVGFLFAFPDISEALQRANGRLTPWAIADLMRDMKHTKWVSINGVGILSEFQGVGGNALLYSEMGKTVSDYGFEHADLTQVAETAVQMRRDLINLGGKAYKNHRVFQIAF